MATDSQKLKRFLTAMDGDNLALTGEDFVKSFEMVVSYVKQVDENLSSQLETALGRIKELQDDLRNNNKTAVEDMKKMLNTLFVGDKFASLEEAIRRAVDAKIVEIDRKAASVRNGANGRDGGRGPAGRDGSPDTPQQIVSKLSSLRGNERLGAEAIDGLDERIKSVSRASGGGGPVFVPTGGANGGKTVKYYDISGDLDGSTKTFTLPAFHRIISVHCSSQPFIFRPTTDWTADASAMTITFTSAVDETLSLATGQSVVVVYAEN